MMWCHSADWREKSRRFRVFPPRERLSPGDPPLNRHEVPTHHSMSNDLVFIIMDSCRFDSHSTATTQTMDRPGEGSRRYPYASWTRDGTSVAEGRRVAVRGNLGS